jgi:tetratricopeptide (TPR) repeat protein/ferredoxin
VCTSNVDVANEVKLHKMVVDPGCMKCLDCVSVCPNDALYFGLGRPSFGISPKRSARRYDLSLVEELAALVLGFGAFLAYRGLYGKSPFLMSLGCAGIATYLLMKAASLFYRHDVVLQKNVLKSDGRIQKAGWVVLFPTILLLAFTAHSGAVQYQAYLGKRVLAGLPTEYFGWQRNREGLQLRGQDREAAAAARAHFAFCEKWGLLATLENEQRLAWLDLLGGHINEALQRVRQIAASHPDYALDWVKLGNFETFAGHREEAGKAYQRAMEIDRGPRERIAAKHPDEQFPLSAQAYAEWGLFLADDGATDRAQEALEKSVKLDRTSAMAWMALGGFQLGTGQIDRARQSLLQACLLEPHALPPLEMVERIGRADQDFAAALRDYDEVAGKQFVFRYNRAHALVRLRRYDEAIAAYRKLVEEQPGLVEIRADLGAVLLATSDLNGAIGQFEIVATALPSDSEAHFKLGYLYHQVGRGADAAREYQTAIRLGGPGKDLAEQGLKALNSEGGR